MVVTRSKALGENPKGRAPEKKKIEREDPKGSEEVPAMKKMKKRKYGERLSSEKEIPPREDMPLPEQQPNEEATQECLPWGKVVLVLGIILVFLAFFYKFISSFEKEDPTNPTCLSVDQITSADDLN